MVLYGLGATLLRLRPWKRAVAGCAVIGYWTGVVVLPPRRSITLLAYGAAVGTVLFEAGAPKLSKSTAGCY